MLALVRSDSTSGKDAKLGMMDLSGSLTRQVGARVPVLILNAARRVLEEEGDHELVEISLYQRL